MASNNLPAVQNTSESMLSAIAANQLGIWSSIDATTEEGKLDVFDALSAGQNMDDAGMLEVPFNLKDVIIQVVQVVDNEGEISDALRTILIADDGKVYTATSQGLLNSVRNLFGVVGMPVTWSKPLPVVVKRQKGRRGFYFYSLSLFRGGVIDTTVADETVTTV